MPCNPVSVSYAVVTRGERERMKGKAGNRRKGREGKRFYEEENVGKRWR